MKRRPLHFEGAPLRAEEFRLLRDLFSARTGLQYGPEARFTMERRLRERLDALSLTSFAEYYHHLRFSPQADEEWTAAIDLLTTNETYFFREPRQLRAFQAEVLPMLREQALSRKRLQIWSAGCSTGEEVYTLAMLILESRLFPKDEGWDVRVYGSDISKRCVTHARKGLYGVAAFRAMPDEYRKFFLRKAEGELVVESVRALCHFGQLNLLHEDSARVIGRADAIFCRNVLIYLDTHARRQVIDMFHERLFPGGVLFLGHSESLLNVTTAFELLHLREDLVYRKPRGQFRTPPNFGKV